MIGVMTRRQRGQDEGNDNSNRSTPQPQGQHGVKQEIKQEPDDDR